MKSKTDFKTLWRHRNMRRIIGGFSLLCCSLLSVLSFSPTLFSQISFEDKPDSFVNQLSDSISRIVADQPGEIGVAVIVNNRDTIAVNNNAVYPMMSVFKLHQALSVCKMLENKGISLDSIISVNREKLNPNTWSPMLKDHNEEVIKLSVKDLLRYTLVQSDNNASNLMFDKIACVEYTDSLIATFLPRSCFSITFTEEDMFTDHDKAYSNYSSPIGAAILMNRLFTENLIAPTYQDFIKSTLEECLTGNDRIVAPLKGKEGVRVAHKTGSGYVNHKGELTAHNDVAYIQLQNNTNYSLAVFVKDFNGNEKQASEVIARISYAVYSILKQSAKIVH